MKKKWIFMPMFVLLVFFAFDMKPVHAMVTSMTMYRQEDPELGKRIYSSIFEINNGEKYAFCIERSKFTPTDGDPISEWIELYNEDLRKVLYYGYNGPENMGYSVVETSCGAAAAYGDNETSIGRRVLEEVQALPSPPANFRVWMVETNGGSTQNIAFYTTLTTGQLILEKVDEENPEMKLSGAVYGIYSDEECTVKIGEITTDESGKSSPVEVPEGLCFLKELVAPEGYQISDDIMEVDILVERTITVTATDSAEVPTVEMIVRKQNEKGEPLAEAEFELYEDKECTVFVTSGNTNESGELIFAELVKGKIYYLKEVKAPEGYFLSNKVYEVVADGTEIFVTNEKVVVLPNTGSNKMLFLELTGIWCMIKSRKKER